MSSPLWYFELGGFSPGSRTDVSPSLLPEEEADGLCGLRDEFLLLSSWRFLFSTVPGGGRVLFAGV